MDSVTTPEERHRRLVAAFARWLTRYRRHDSVTRMAIQELARSIAYGEHRGRERDAALDYLDDLLDIGR